MQRVILRSYQSPGDIVMLTAALRDLHKAAPGSFVTDVRTSAAALWENSPYITPLDEHDRDVLSIDMHYPLIHQSNQRPYHFIHGFVQFLEQQLDVRIPITAFKGDIHLSEEERGRGLLPAEVPEHFWIIVGGGKFDFTAKWWNPDSYQAVVDHFRDQIHFVQCGEQGHWHPKLRGATDLIGKTNLRQFVSLMHHAEGVICPVTFAMHLAAAVEARSGHPTIRPCVVVAGGREPSHWEAYPGHQFVSTNGMIDCCAQGGCWKSRCQLVGDGDSKDSRDVCELPVQIREDLRIPKCMDMITAEDVIRRVEWYLEGRNTPRAKRHSSIQERVRPMNTLPSVTEVRSNDRKQQASSGRQVLLEFRHGLGDAVQLTTVLAHLRHYHPDWNIDVAALPGKSSAFRGQCRRVLTLKRDAIDPKSYDDVFSLDWPECATCYSDSPSTKAERCLREIFGLQPIVQLCRYSVTPRAADLDAAKTYLERDCGLERGEDGRFPTVLIHYEGNTSAAEKNLHTSVAKRLCEVIIECGAVPVILDWDSRSPLPDNHRIFNPHVDLEIWNGLGTGDAARIAALIQMSRLMIGIDSGPLHVAGAVDTPTIAVWTEHHPLHYFGIADHVTHLVRSDHERFLRGDRQQGLRFFEEHYRFETCTDLRSVLCAKVEQALHGTDHDGLSYTRNFWVRSDNVEQDLVVVSDIFENDSYRVCELDLPQPVVIDVGAHIGCFSAKFRQNNPSARIIAVECCPENLPVLEKNIGSFANVVHGAVTYERDVALKNAVFPNCVTTGGSTVVPRAVIQELLANKQLPDNIHGVREDQYWADMRSLPTLTLEEICEREKVDRIDVLKLDCEGSEFSILENTTMLPQIRTIVGEYHGRERFHELVKRRFSDWELRILKDGELGTFWLRNPTFSSDLPTSSRPNRSELQPPTARERTSNVPALLVAAMRSEPEPCFDLLWLQDGRIVASLEHPQAWLRGFTRWQGRIWTVDSLGTFYEVQFQDGGLTLRTVATIPEAMEAHDLTVVGQRLVTVGPWHDAIILLDPLTGQAEMRRPWLAPGRAPAEGEQRDRFHLNSIAHDGEQFCFSMFSVTPKLPEQRWREMNLRDGVVIRWGPHGFAEKLVAKDMYAPHSVRFHDSSLWWCESFQGCVHREDGWHTPHLGGFARGLRFHAGRLLVALSKSRVAPNPTLDVCGIASVSIQDPEQYQVIPLEKPYFEIYDFLPLYD